jgi:hypothetical protein
MQKKPQNQELSKVLDFLKIALRTSLVVFYLNIFKNDIFVNFSFGQIFYGKNYSWKFKMAL